MNSLSLLLDVTNYAYNPYALVRLVCALAVTALGVFIVARERFSRVGSGYLLLSLIIALWFLGFGLASLATNAQIADRWLRLGHIGIALIPAVTIQVAWSLSRPTAKPGWMLWLAWIGSGGFAVAAMTIPGYFGVPYQYQWGYYARYTVYSSLFLPFLMAVLAATVAVYRRSPNRLRPNSIGARRAKLLIVAFAIGCAGGIDFLPSFGINLYPFGYLSAMISIGLATYVTSRYRLVDVTPEFAVKQIIETMNDGLFVLDKEGIVRVANETLLSMIGLQQDAFIGKPLPAFLRRRLALSEYRAVRRGMPLHNREIDFKRRDGTSLVLSLAVSIMPDAENENTAYVCVVRDITEHRHAEQHIRFLAYYDSLTGLPNRRLFHEQLNTALAKAARAKRVVALLFLDLDHFKRINDSLGHALGDRLLQTVAGRLLGCVRRSRIGMMEADASVARFGGDEFIVALFDLDKQDDVPRIAARILAAVSAPIRLDQHEIAITTSLGISVYPRDGEDADTLLKNADAAMYQAKETGRNDFFFYDRTLDAEMHDRLLLEAKLRKALELGHLSLHYQPQVTNQGESVGVEALLRWTNPDLGPIPPSRFIPIAEESGLILPIGEWVLKAACAQARAWQDAGLPPLRVAVNLSSRQFRDRDLVAVVRNALELARLEPRYLELELTESMVMQDALHTRQTLEALKVMGVKLSIDDFGTGYSSLSYLRSFAIDTLKIDRSFVHDIGTGPDKGAIVAAIIAMAHSLKLGVIGEGVETETQRAFLEQHGCKLAQGFLFCEPLPAAELKAWLLSSYPRISRRQT